MTKTRVVHCKKESYDIYIGRPSEWGNPWSHRGSKYSHTPVETAEEAIKEYELQIRHKIKNDPQYLNYIKSELKGKTLGCWCKPGPCHGDILAELADSE